MVRSFNWCRIGLPGPTNKNIVAISTYSLFAKNSSVDAFYVDNTTDRTILYHCLLHFSTLFTFSRFSLTPLFLFFLDFFLLDFLRVKTERSNHSITQLFTTSRATMSSQMLRSEKATFQIQ